MEEKLLSKDRNADVHHTFISIMAQGCVNTGLCLFDEPGIQTDVISSKIVDYHPVSNIESGDTPIHFEVVGNSEEYIDCDCINLLLKVIIVKLNAGKKSNITDADKAGLINLPITSLFHDVSLTLNDKQIEGGQHSYAYSAYLSTLSQYQKQAKKTHLRACGWEYDEAGKFDTETNKGFVDRQKLSKDSNVFELYGPVHLDFFRQSRYLLSNVNMRLKFLRSKPEFALMAFGKTTDFKIIISSATLFVRKLLMNPSVINGHAVGLKKHNAVYPVNHSELTTFTIPRGAQSHVKDRLFPVSMPKALYIAMVENDAYNGSLKKNPFNLQHFGLSKLALYSDGDYCVYKPFEPDFDKKLYLREYCSTMMSLGMFNTDDSNNIKYEDFGNGSYFQMFDLTPDNQVNSTHRHPTRAGNLRLELSFAKALSTTVNVLLYAIYDAKVEITELRDILPSYQR